MLECFVACRRVGVVSELYNLSKDVLATSTVFRFQTHTRLFNKFFNYHVFVSLHLLTVIYTYSPNQTKFPFKLDSNKANTHIICFPFEVRTQSSIHFSQIVFIKNKIFSQTVLLHKQNRHAYFFSSTLTLYDDKQDGSFSLFFPNNTVLQQASFNSPGKIKGTTPFKLTPLLT